MIGAMPAVAVRHERGKRSKRPSHLYIGGHWLPPTSPSPTPSPNGLHDNDHLVPEYYLCGKLSILQIIVGALLLGSIVLVVGLVQLMPNAADADHRFIFLSAGSGLLLGGIMMTALRYFCMRRRYMRHTADEPPPTSGAAATAAIDAVHSIDVLVQRKDTQGTLPSELDILIDGGNANSKDASNDRSNEQAADAVRNKKTSSKSHHNSNERKKNLQ